MDLSLGVQIGINTLMLASVYALIAIGLNLIYGIMRIVQFAHGQLYMIGAFIVWVMCAHFSVNFFLSLPIAAGIVGGISLVMERVLYRPLRGDVLRSMIMGIGLIAVLEGACQMIFGGRQHAIESPLPGVVHFWGVSLPQDWSRRLMCWR